MGSETAVEMFVAGLLLDKSTQAPVVVLKDESGAISLPIWIGIAEATAIASVLNQIPMARPLTHDLMTDVVAELGGKLERIVITELRESTYFAELVVAHGEKAMIFDARPSDAIALALRSSAAIFVAESVLAQAKVAFTGMSAFPDPSQNANPESQIKAEGEEVAEGQEEGPPASCDLTNIDKEQWVEILKNLDPDDFKYKM